MAKTKQSVSVNAKKVSLNIHGKKAAKKTTTAKKTTAEKKPKPFPIVGFGASAGGIEAFTEILKYLDSNLGMAYVLIMHLSPNHKSSLPEILQAKTKMPVQVVKDGMEVFANNIYVIPPNTYMSLIDGHLKLAPRSLTAIGNFAVDYFLNALASIYKNNAIGVILSGTATDGTLGLKAIKAEGGITFAQDETAEFKGMPSHAYEAGYVDFLLPPKEIAKELARLVKVAYTVLPSHKIEEVQIKEINNHADDLKKILSTVKGKTGIDFFLHYKRASIYRRVMRRMALNKLDKLQDYSSLIRVNPKEIDHLFDDFLINVTKFFRDPDFYKILVSKVFPSFIKEAKSIAPIRIWVAGCATGEEAYSVAICLLDFLDKKNLTIPIQIFASDLDSNAIEKARLGIYPASALQDVSKSNIKQYFKKLDGHYQVVKSVREICVFSQHNLLRDPPFSRMNLISCQNVLIYLETNPQKKVLQTFHYSLKPTGYLFLGKSETIGTLTDLFEPLDNKVKLYSRKATNTPHLEFLIHSPGNTFPQASLQVDQHVDAEVEKDMSKLMLSRFVHPSVVVNKNLIIIQFFGATSHYLAPVTGRASFNILKMIREDLVIDLRSLLQQARKTEKISIKEGIRIYNKKILQEIAIEVVPKKISGDTFFLVVFKEHATVYPLAKGNGKKSTGSVDHKEKTIVKLEAELIQSLEIIRTTNEEYETTYEELQSNNEEILSSNEELQSVNEELESSKEELQSANEELTTIVDELNKRNIELKESQDYAEAIVETMHGPLLVLTANLQVRRANKAFYQTFKLTAEKTEGCYIYDLGDNAWDIPALREHLKEIFPKNSNFKDFELKHVFPGIGERDLIVNAYKLLNTNNARETLILLAFDDITKLFNAETSLLKAEAQLKLSLVGDSIGTWWWSIATHEMKWSRENEILNGIKEGTFRGLYSDWENLIHPNDVELVKTAIKKSFHEKIPLEIEYRIPWHDRSFRWILTKGHAYFDEHGKPERMIGVSLDSTERKARSESLEIQVGLRTAELTKANKELRTANEQLEQFAFISSHDLQEPLRKIRTFSNLLTNPEANLNDYAKNYSNKINAAATRLSTIVKDLLSFSVLIQDETKKSVKVDLNEILKNVIDDFEVIIQRKKVVVNLHALPTIYAEPVHMNQLFHNLISNALKFARETPVIDISSRATTPEDSLKYPQLMKDIPYVVIMVSDNGIGFEQQYAIKMFTLFQRLNTEKSPDGTGVGLAICKKIVEGHGGFIFADGKENFGATFTIFLPLGQ